MNIAHLIHQIRGKGLTQEDALAIVHKVSSKLVPSEAQALEQVIHLRFAANNGGSSAVSSITDELMARWD